MENSKILFQELLAAIAIRDDPDEARAVAIILLESLFGVTRTDIMSGKEISVQPGHRAKLDSYVKRINAHEPVQYVVGEADFYGRKFNVDPSVLIPRPETEMLVRTVLEWKTGALKRDTLAKVMDIGTGSGCIPITLYHECPGARIFATDISRGALAVATANARRHNAEVTFIHHDILTEDIPVGPVDVIVSNPPYVTKSESTDMGRNVMEFEPHEALFVPDDDPLIFYREILSKAVAVLSPGGLACVEINERFGHEVMSLFKEKGFAEVTIARDMDGKQRVVRGIHDPAR